MKRGLVERYPKEMVVAVVVAVIVVVWIGWWVHHRMFKKTIAIFGSVSKDISNNQKMQQELDVLVASLNPSKYNYIAPNTETGPVGYVLTHVPDRVKSAFLTTYVESFNSKLNETYVIKTFQDAIDYEEYMIRHSNIFVFLPGGVGTMYEVSFVLFLLDVQESNRNLVLFYNKDNYYDFVKEIMKRYEETGYLRPKVYEKFIHQFKFVSDMKTLVSFF